MSQRDSKRTTFAQTRTTSPGPATQPAEDKKIIGEVSYLAGGIKDHIGNFYCETRKAERKELLENLVQFRIAGPRSTDAALARHIATTLLDFIRENLDTGLDEPELFQRHIALVRELEPFTDPDKRSDFGNHLLSLFYKANEITQHLASQGDRWSFARPSPVYTGTDPPATDEVQSSMMFFPALFKGKVTARKAQSLDSELEIPVDDSVSQVPSDDPTTAGMHNKQKKGFRAKLKRKMLPTTGESHQSSEVGPAVRQSSKTPQARPSTQTNSASVFDKSNRSASAEPPVTATPQQALVPANSPIGRSSSFPTDAGAKRFARRTRNGQHLPELGFEEESFYHSVTGDPPKKEDEALLVLRFVIKILVHLHNRLSMNRGGTEFLTLENRHEQSEPRGKREWDAAAQIERHGYQ